MRWIALILALLPAPVAAHEFFLDGLQIIHPSLPATPMGVTSAPVFMVFSNEGTEDERLLAIETPFGPVKFLQPVEGGDGRITLREYAWIDIPAGEIVTLVRGPMEMRGRVNNVTRPLFEGGELTGTMVFEKRGRFDMFFLIDPLEVEEDPTAAPLPEETGDRASDISTIATALRAELGQPQAMIAPIVIAGDFAIAGWSQGDSAARAFLRRRGGTWEVTLWSGKSLMLPAALTSLGVPATLSGRLRAELAAQEEALGAGFTSRADRFPGTVFVEDGRGP